MRQVRRIIINSCRVSKLNRLINHSPWSAVMLERGCFQWGGRKVWEWGGRSQQTGKLRCKGYELLLQGIRVAFLLVVINDVGSCSSPFSYTPQSLGRLPRSNIPTDEYCIHKCMRLSWFILYSSCGVTMFSLIRETMYHEFVYSGNRSSLVHQKLRG